MLDSLQQNPEVDTGHTSLNRFSYLFFGVAVILRPVQKVT